MLVEFVQSLPTGLETQAAGKFQPATRISTKIYHLGFLVGNSERSMDFYGNVLGFKETWRAELKDMLTLHKLTFVALSSGEVSLDAPEPEQIAKHFSNAQFVKGCRRPLPAGSGCVEVVSANGDTG